MADGKWWCGWRRRANYVWLRIYCKHTSHMFGVDGSGETKHWLPGIWLLWCMHTSPSVKLATKCINHCNRPPHGVCCGVGGQRLSICIGVTGKVDCPSQRVCIWYVFMLGKKKKCWQRSLILTFQLRLDSFTARKVEFEQCMPSCLVVAKMSFSTQLRVWSMYEGHIKQRFYLWSPGTFTSAGLISTC